MARIDLEPGTVHRSGAQLGNVAPARWVNRLNELVRTWVSPYTSTSPFGRVRQLIARSDLDLPGMRNAQIEAADAAAVEIRQDASGGTSPAAGLGRQLLLLRRKITCRPSQDLPSHTQFITLPTRRLMAPNDLKPTATPNSTFSRLCANSPAIATTREPCSTHQALIR